MAGAASLAAVLLASGTASAHVAFDGLDPGTTFVAGSTVEIQWIDTIKHETIAYHLYFTPSATADDVPIAIDIPPTQHSYMWQVPDQPCSDCSLHVIQDNGGGDYSDRVSIVIVAQGETTDGGAPDDGGATDPPSDAGTDVDAGPDAGTEPPLDAGMEPPSDAGTEPPSDAGTGMESSPDAGTAMDSSPDAGSGARPGTDAGAVPSATANDGSPGAGATDSGGGAGCSLGAGSEPGRGAAALALGALLAGTVLRRRRAPRAQER